MIPTLRRSLVALRATTLTLATWFDLFLNKQRMKVCCLSRGMTKSKHFVDLSLLFDFMLGDKLQYILIIPRKSKCESGLRL